MCRQFCRGEPYPRVVFPIFVVEILVFVGLCHPMVFQCPSVGVTLFGHELGTVNK